MPKIKVSLRSIFLKMVVRPSRSTQRLSTGGSRRAEFINFSHFFSTGYPAFFQALQPPLRAKTCRYPF